MDKKIKLTPEEKEQLSKAKRKARNQRYYQKAKEISPEAYDKRVEYEKQKYQSLAEDERKAINKKKYQRKKELN